MLTLVRDWGLRVTERPIPFEEILAAPRTARCAKCSAPAPPPCISAVGELGHAEGKIVINNGEVGPIAQRLYKGITDIQYGRVPDKYGWLTYVS